MCCGVFRVLGVRGGSSDWMGDCVGWNEMNGLESEYEFCVYLVGYQYFMLVIELSIY